MVIVTLKKCCCFQLEVGIIVLAWIDIVLNTLGAIFFAIFLTHGSDIKKFYEENYKIQYDEVSATIGFGILLGMKLLLLISAILLLVGAMKRKRLLLIPYLLMEGIYLGIVIFYCVARLFSINSLGAFVSFLFWGLFTALLIYLYLCVLSFYYLLRAEETRPPNATPMVASPYNPQMYQQPPPYPGYTGNKGNMA